MFKDINPSLQPHPDTRDITVRTEIAAINGSINNIIQTNKYERPYQPTLCGEVDKLLFENPSEQISTLLKTIIEQAISNFEKRATNVAVEVAVSSNRYGYEVYIAYNAAVSGKRASLTLGLNKH